MGRMANWPGRFAGSIVEHQGAQRKSEEEEGGAGLAGESNSLPATH